MNLTISDYAFLSSFAYVRTGQFDFQGWSVIKTNNGINGFQAVAFGNDINNDGYYDEIVISYAGTNSPTDIIFDDFGGIVLGNVPGQYTSALNFYNEILKMNNVSLVSNVTLTGHSLGGALAQLVAAKTGVSAITFNAPGMKYALSK